MKTSIISTNINFDALAILYKVTRNGELNEAKKLYLQESQ